MSYIKLLRKHAHIAHIGIILCNSQRESYDSSKESRSAGNVQDQGEFYVTPKPKTCLKS